MSKLKKGAFTSIAVFLLLAVLGSTVGIIGRLNAPRKETSVVSDFGYIKDSYARGQGYYANMFPDNVIRFEPGVEDYDISGLILNGGDDVNSYSYVEGTDSYAQYSISKAAASSGTSNSRIGLSLKSLGDYVDGFYNFSNVLEADICIESPGDIRSSTEDVKWFLRFDFGTAYGSSGSVGGIYFHRVDNTAEDPNRSEKYFGVSIILYNQVISTAEYLFEYGTWHNFCLKSFIYSGTYLYSSDLYVDNKSICSTGYFKVSTSSTSLKTVSLVPRGYCGGLKFSVDNLIAFEFPTK